MNSNEIISIFFGPYANYIGAHLINHEHYQLFNTIEPVSTTDSIPQLNQSTPSNQHTQQLPTQPHILFQPSKSTQSLRQNSYYVPRVLYCDYEGCIPIQHASQITMSNFKQSQNAQQNTRFPTYDALNQCDFTYSTTAFSSTSYTYTSTTQHKQIEQDDNNYGHKEQLYWHNILYPHLRPMTYAPESIILTSPNHVLGLSGDACTESSLIMSKPTSQTSSKHEETFSETLFDQFRILIEQADHPQGVRILCDPSSIWGGVTLTFIQHLRTYYPNLYFIIIGVSTPYTLDSTTSNIENELFAYNCYNIPYSPFFHNNGINLAPSQIKNVILSTREKRLLNSTLFLSQIAEEDKCIYIPITFPLTTELLQFFKTKLPTLIHKYNTHKQQQLKQSTTPSASSQQQQSTSSQQQLQQNQLSQQTQILLSSIATITPDQLSLLYHTLTSPQIAISLLSLFETMYIAKSSSSSIGGSSSDSCITTISQFVNTLRTRSVFPIATLAHRHDPKLFSSFILNGVKNGSNGNSNNNGQNNNSNNQNTDLYDSYQSTYTDKSLFPTLSLDSIGLIPIYSNLYQQTHQQQIDNEIKRQKLLQFQLQYTNHSNSNNGQDVSELYGNESLEKINPMELKRMETIQIGSSFTIGNFDQSIIDELITPTQQQNESSMNQNTNNNNSTQVMTTKPVINGVFASSDQMQYQYECQQRQKHMQMGLYSQFNQTKPSQFLFVPQNFSPTPSTPSVLYTKNAMKDISSLSQLFWYGHNTPSSNSTNTTKSTHQSTINMLHLPQSSMQQQESISSVFLSPKLSISLTTLSNYLKSSEKSTTRLTTFNSIEYDDWVEHYHQVKNISTEYKEMELY